MKKRSPHPFMVHSFRSTRSEAPFRSLLFRSLALACLSLLLLPDAATAQPKWGNFQRDHCTKLGHRQYASVLEGIPWGQSWEETCARTPATISGQYFANPNRCVNEGPGVRMWGEFDVPDATCQSHWGTARQEHCTSTETRQYSAVLEGIPEGMSWEDACGQTPNTIAGTHFANPARCVNEGPGIRMWGQFDVPDPSCAGPEVSFSPTVEEGCWGIYTEASGGYLSHNGLDNYVADRDEINEWERFYLKETAPGTFLIYDTQRQYLKASDSKVGKTRLYTEDDVEASTWEAVRVGPNAFALRSGGDGQYLRVESNTYLSTTATQGDREVFHFVEANQCAAPPSESEVNTTVEVLPSSGGPLWGIADLHGHAFTHEGFGGLAFQGKPFHPLGLDAAMPWCDHAHGPGGTWDVLGWNMDGDLPFINLGSLGHLVGGSPEFDGWPRWNSSDHQQMYYKWIERAFRGGLRLQTMLAVNNKALCEPINQKDGYGCEDMPAVDRQIEGARQLEAFVDEQHGGPGKGWFRIAESAEEARDIIESGKMAVVLGIEVDALFGCKVGECTEADVARELDKYYSMGVRHVFPVHVFDNAFGGAALYSQVFTVGNHAINGTFLEAEDCSAIGYDGIEYRADLSFTDGVLSFFSAEGQVPGYPAVNSHCNTRSLTELGTFLIEELMKRKMIIDVDHMGAKTLDAVLDIAEEKRYPVVGGHTGFLDLSQGPKASEAQKSANDVERIRAMGGLVAPILHQGSVAETNAFGTTVANNCDESSKSWAQAYLYAVDKMQGAAVPLGSDMNGWIHQPAPRYGPEACAGNAAHKGQQTDAQKVRYPFNAHGVSGTFDKLRTGQRVFDFNTDGFANIGLLPDFIQDLKNVGLTDDDLKPLFSSAEAYVAMWERIEAQGTDPEPVEPDPEPIEPDPEPPSTISGYVTGKSSPNKCLHKKFGGWDNGNPIHVWDCNDGSAENKTWTYDPNTGYIRGMANPAKCLHKKFGGWDNGNPIHVWDCNAGSAENKTWSLGK